MKMPVVSAKNRATIYKMLPFVLVALMALGVVTPEQLDAAINGAALIVSSATAYLALANVNPE